MGRRSLRILGLKRIIAESWRFVA